MGYLVRNADGELRFPNLRDLGNAYRAGLVEPDDDVQDEHTQGWRKASAVMGYAPKRSATAARRWYLAGAALLVLNVLAFFWLRGHWMGLGAWVLIEAVVAFQITPRLIRIKRSPLGR